MHFLLQYWTFHDRDIAPEADTLEETNKNLDEMADLIEQLQKETGIKLLWNTCNLFAHPRFEAHILLKAVFINTSCPQPYTEQVPVSRS